MAAPVEEKHWTSNDGVAPPHAPIDPEPVADEPLEVVGDEKDLNQEKVLDPDVAAQKEELEEYEEYNHQGKDAGKETVRAPFERTQSNWTTATGTSYAESASESGASVKEERRPWSEKINPFKRKKKPPVPEQRQISREYGANFFSKLTFQWMAPLMDVGYQRPLESNDLWIVNPDRSTEALTGRMMEAFKRRSEAGEVNPLRGALYDTFKMEFLLGGFCQCIASIVQVSSPFTLRYLINFATEAYVAQHSGGAPPSIGKGLGSVFGITAMQMIQSLCTNHFLYRGMIIGGQARAVTIAVIFDKAMRLSGRAKAGGKSTKLQHEQATPPKGVAPGSKEEKMFFKKRLGKQKGNADIAKGVSGDGQGWSNGRIINLMSTDTYRIDQASGMFHMIWTSPLAILLTLALLSVNLTYSALAGFGLLVIAMPLLGRAIRSLFTRRRAINKITDQRVGLMQEVLQGVRFVKYFGWETSFLDRSAEIRDREIHKIQFLLSIRNAIMAVSMSMPVFASMLAFITYSLSNHVSNPGPIFSSSALFNSLRLPLNSSPMVIGQVVDASASINRIQEFLLAEEAQDEAVWDYENKNAIVIKDADFTWERTPTQDPDKVPGKGPRSAKQVKAEKKTAKKAAKEARKASAAIDKNEKDVSTAASTPDSPATPTHVLDSSSTLAADENDHPFHISSVNLNIARNELIAVIGTVGSGKSSLLAASAGDMRRTSGSVTLGASRAFCPQYAWIQNATVKENIVFGKPFDKRWYNAVVDACASRPDLDMLPAGDLTEIGERGITVSGGQKQRSNIARAIYFNADIVLMDDPSSAVDAHVGRHIMDNAICGSLRDKCRVSATHQLHVLHRCDRIVVMKEGRIHKVDTFDRLMAGDEEFATLMKQTAVEKHEDEDKVDGDGDERAEEKKDVTKKKKGRKPAAALMQVEERAVKSVSFSIYKAYISASGSWLTAPLVIGLLISSQGANIVTSSWSSWWTSDKFGYSEGTYIGAYAALGATQAIMMFAFSVALTVFGTRASKVMLHRAVTRVSRAPMSFFDTTPLGRITNRFSKDVDTMDNTLTDSFRMFFMTMAQIIAVFALIIAYFYYFAIALGPLFLMFLFSASYYRASAREIKRHESVLRSTVFSRFSEAVSGVSTIRAYGLQNQFSLSVRDAIDTMNGAYFSTFSNQRWSSTRLDAIGNLLVFTVGILVVTSRFSVNPSTGGSVSSYILSIVMMIQFTVRQLAEVENNMNSTERIHYYGVALEEEAALVTNADVHLPPSWPERGEIEFRDVAMRYRPGSPLVSHDLTSHIRAGERIGVVGRTGAGKSSIMSTLFRLIELDAGTITIDGVDISRVGLRDLRSRLSIIPQDPTSFRGTIRSNLDPFNEHTDTSLWAASRQADLVGQEQDIADTSARITLSSAVEEEGSNFSLGQRQSLALSRASVRGSRIIVCDEATSSVDFETDRKIQKTILEGFRGIFRGMCERSGITRNDFIDSEEARMVPE